MSRGAGTGPDGLAIRCPTPAVESEVVVSGHGSGGRLSQALLDQLLIPGLGLQQWGPLHDGAIIEVAGERLAFTTDSYVVDPLFFPGGDIGSLAVFGTVNDLAMCGAGPLCLSLALILEEGLSLDTLARIVSSVRAAADRVPVRVVTGDTKVVPRGKGDGVFINTAGLGRVLPGANISPARMRAGDRLLLSAPIGAHGMAILSQRESLGFETDLRSDVAPLADLVARLIAELPEAIHVLRDPTRGGLATTLNELARAAGTSMNVVEERIPIPPPVAAACEVLGLDPLYVANEGCLLAVVERNAAERALAIVRGHPLGREAQLIGDVASGPAGQVVFRTRLGGQRVLDWRTSEQMPRIC